MTAQSKDFSFLCDNCVPDGGTVTDLEMLMKDPSAFLQACGKKKEKREKKEKKEILDSLVQLPQDVPFTETEQEEVRNASICFDTLRVISHILDAGIPGAS